MNPRKEETQVEVPTFDFSAFPPDTLFLDRRTLPGAQKLPAPVGDEPALPAARRPRKDRRRRVDPTTFEKQYNEEEMEFMNAIQEYKSRSGKMFPSHGDILKVALNLGYRKFLPDGEEPVDEVAPEPIATVG